MHPIFDREACSDRNLEYQVALIRCHIAWNMIIAHLLWIRVNHDGLTIRTDALRKIEEIGNVDISLASNALLKPQCVRRNRFIIERESQLSRLTGCASLGDKAIDQRCIET